MYKCVCAHGFRGKNCESKYQESWPYEENWWDYIKIEHCETQYYSLLIRDWGWFEFGSSLLSEQRLCNRKLSKNDRAIFV